MISPELLRRYPCFGQLDDAQLRAIASIAREEQFKRGATLIREGQPAEALCLLMKGNIDLHITVEDENNPKSRKDYPVGEINVGELFGLGSLVEPHCYNVTARAADEGILLKIDGAALRGLLEKDEGLAFQMMRHVAQALSERLQATRLQLAAARL
jgi:CRP-like cAMP-binding protein